jgi:O-antigen/teichoic acid export membrane protein
MAVLTVPVGCGLSLVAAPVVRLAFGTQWLAAVPLVQLLGVAGILTLFGSVSATLFAANAWLRTMMHVNIVIAALRVAFLVIFVPRMGVLGAGLAVAITDIADQLIYLTITVRKLEIPVGAIVGRVARTLFASAAMAFVVILSGLGRGGWPTSTGALSVRLAEIVLLGASVYVVVLLATWVSFGRPEGAESEVIRLSGRVFRRNAVKSC